MIGDMLVPIDGSKNSRRALRIAAAIARPLGGQLDVICFSRGPLSAEFRRTVERMTHDEVQAVPTHIEVAEQHGPAERQIAASVAEHPSSLVCMAAHGRSRSPALLGSVTEAIIGAALRPVLLVGPSVATVSFDPRRRLLLTADSAEQRAIGRGWQLLFGCDVDQAPFDFVLTHAQQLPTSIIVATVDKPKRTRRLVWGDSTTGLIHDALCPVLAIDAKAQITLGSTEASRLSEE